MLEFGGEWEGWMLWAVVLLSVSWKCLQSDGLKKVICGILTRAPLKSSDSIASHLFISAHHRLVLQKSQSSSSGQEDKEECAGQKAQETRRDGGFKAQESCCLAVSPQERRIPLGRRWGGTCWAGCCVTELDVVCLLVGNYVQSHNSDARKLQASSPDFAGH